jgi:beta-lactam-binding protein with PASTA domain
VVATVGRSSHAPTGTVIATQPKAGHGVKPGTHVAIVYSQGPIVDVSVPPVAGLGLAAAQNALAAKGLSYKDRPVTSWNSPVIPNTVLAQSPLAGNVVPSTRVVYLTVLAPNGTYPVPNVTGFPPASAGSTLGQYGLTVGTQSSQCSSSVPNGDVASTSPAAGMSVQQGTAIDLVVSTGACAVTVPNVVGLTQAQATSQITAAQLNAVIVPCATGPSTDLVVSQSPVPLTPVQPGTSVTAQLGCSTAPPPTTTTTTTFGAVLGGNAWWGDPWSWTWRRG